MGKGKVKGKNSGNHKGREYSSRDLMILVKENGWTLVRTKGDDHIFKHPHHPMVMKFPHYKKTLCTGTVAAALNKMAQANDNVKSLALQT